MRRDIGGKESSNIQDDTSERVYFWYSRDYAVHHYPDTILPTVFPVQIGEVGPNNGAGTGTVNPNWQEIFLELPESKFSVYFFDGKPQNQEGRDALIQSPNQFERKDITLEELEENDFVIRYP